MVRLDTTLSDLYRQCSPEVAKKRYGHVYCSGNSAVSMSSEFPRLLKYINQDSVFQNRAKHESREDDGD
jgi:hypothetical protein